MDITTLVSAVISLCVALITIIIIPTLRARYGQEKIDAALAIAKQVKYWVNVFVVAAEQIYPAAGSGVIKKEYVVKLINTKLDELGLKVNSEELDAQIESSVLELKKELKANSPEEY